MRIENLELITKSPTLSLRRAVKRFYSQVEFRIHCTHMAFSVQLCAVIKNDLSFG